MAAVLPLVTPEFEAYLRAAQAANLAHVQATNVFYRLPQATAALDAAAPPLPVFCLCPANLTDCSDAFLADLEMYCIRVRTTACFLVFQWVSALSFVLLRSYCTMRLKLVGTSWFTLTTRPIRW